MFAANALSNKLLRSTLFTLTQVQQLLLNNVALYIAAVFIAAHAFYSVPFGSVTGFFAVFVSMQTFLYHYFAREEKYAKTTHATLALFLLIIFIAFKWEGVTVTLLWLLTAVILFGSGVYFKSISLRMSAIVLMGITLLKLVILDSRNFTTVQKIIAYITLGALLLIVSFFYQKFKERLFSKE